MIKNKTKNTVISEDHILCTTISSKARGLMFKKKPKTMVFEFSGEQKHSLHMMFVFFSIDVLFLDKNKKIVEIKERFRPFTLYDPKEKARYIIELEEDSVFKSECEVGDIVDF